jgi:hypothetical protein
MTKEVSAVTETSTVRSNVSNLEPTGFGMPAPARVRVAALRDLPGTTGVVSVGAGDTCAHIAGATAYRSAIADVVFEGAFPGASAWSPPI